MNVAEQTKYPNVYKSEVWRPVIDFPGYEVSNFGGVRSLDRLDSAGRPRRGVNMSLCNNKGYKVVNLSNNGKMKMMKAHRLVATAFIKNPSKAPDINHKDGNKQNNYYKNLEWATALENNRHAFKIGLREASYGNCKLNLTKVKRIRSMHPRLSHARIGKIFGVSSTTIYLIIHRKTWTHAN